tara:strand:+ start:70 stop:393 length:324 start_codon:yes stop_codon:yes gene_type:complete
MVKLHFLTSMSGLTAGFNFDDWKQKMVYGMIEADNINGARAFRFDGPSSALQGHHAKYRDWTEDLGDHETRKTFDDLFDYPGNIKKFGIETGQSISEAQDVFANDWH